MYLHANLYEFGICRVLEQVYFQTDYLPVKSRKGLFCLHYENLVELLKVKLNKNVTEAH